MEWQPIDMAPKDGTRILCWAKDWKPTFLVWKQNPRIIQAHHEGDAEELATWYFGDPEEMDDYEFAKSGGGPTHWLDIQKPPIVEGTGSRVATDD